MAHDTNNQKKPAPVKITSGWRRVLNLQQRARAKCLSGVLIHKPENIYYFTSVYPHEPSFLIIPLEGEPELVVARSALVEAERDSLIPVVPGEIDIAASAYARMQEKKVLKSPPDTIFKSMLRKIGESPIGLELDYISAYLFQYFKIRNHMDISPEIDAMRSVKSGFEIEHITDACRIADAAMARTRERITPGMTEREVSGIFDAHAKALGAEESKCRVRSGKNTALAFSRWMDGILDRGPLLIDYGARVKGYWSDITRMFHLGAEPDPFFLEIYHLVLAAQKNALEIMRPGQSIYEPEARIRKTFREKGFEQNMIYTAGHGVGLEIHEAPLLGSPPLKKIKKETQPTPQANENMQAAIAAMLEEARGDDDAPVLEYGQIFALEPGLYFPDIGVRVEDMVHISQEPVLLSTFPTSVEEMIIPI